LAVTAPTEVCVAPIRDTDRSRVGAFLHANLNARLSGDDWTRAISVPWDVESPNAGFMLLDGDEVVGVQLAFYSERSIEGRRERFCNLGAWCVLPEHRFHSLRLLKAALGQRGYHFTDLSPSGNVVRINSRLNFRFLDTATILAPNLPWPSSPGPGTITSDPALIERTLTGHDLQLYRDHATAGAARQLVLIRGDESCLVIFRKDRWKRLRLFVSILYVGNPELLRELARPFGRHLLLRHGAVAVLAEPRVLGYRPRPGFEIQSPRRKMLRSADLNPTDVDYLYSELVCVSW